MAPQRNFETYRDPSGRQWYNASVVALMRECSQAHETPAQTIRRLARDMVLKAKADGWSGLPFDPELLADIEGIRVEKSTIDFKAEARLLPLADRRLQIEYMPGVAETRRRFSICHELAHTFFPDCFEQIQHRRPAAPHDPLHAELEQLCHVGAGELLMPLTEFQELSADRPPDFFVAADLAKSFCASAEAALRRMVDLSAAPYCLVWMSERLKPTQERNAGPELDFGFDPPQAKLRIDYQFASSSWKGYFPTHKSVPDSSRLYNVLGSLAYDQGAEDWSDLKLGNVYVEAMKSMHPSAGSRGVVALVRPLYISQV